MITKERLEELIEQGTTIYTTYGGYLSDIQLNRKYDYVTDNHLFEADMVAGEVGYRKYTFNILFETIEDAEWYREFGCIERTERLVLPTWEESKECETICCFGDVEFDYFVHDNTYCLYQDCYKLLDLEATKENYTLACRKAKELFLGLGENK